MEIILGSDYMDFRNNRNFINFIYMVVGVFFIALGLHSFALPYKIVAGGMNGVGVIVYQLTGITPDITLMVSNIPLLMLSLIFLGKKYTLNTIFCSFLLPVILRVFNFIPAFNGEPMLAAIFSGVFVGVGAGLIFKGESSSGGTSILQQIFHDKFHISYGTAIMIIDGTILLSSFLFFNVSIGLYSIISLYIIGKLVDIVQSGGTPAKTTLIISNKTEELTDEFINNLQLGVTLLKGHGAYSKKDKDVILCTFPDKRIVDVKNKIFEIDPESFCIVVDAREVLGYRWNNYN